MRAREFIQETTIPDMSGESRTINVDGVMRPTTNSNGQPIHPTKEGVRNFWKWFGDSKVVDAQGRPQVVYHGTNSDIEYFDEKYLGKSVDNPTTKFGFYFTDSSSGADKWSSYNPRMSRSRTTMPVYLKIETPKILNSEEFHYYLQRAQTKTIEKHLTKWKERFNGVFIHRENGEKWFVVFSPDQIKSATGNNGDFSPKSKIITEVPLPPDWDEEQMKKQKGTTFKSRVAYAISKSKKIGMGSSRVVVKIEEGGKPTALKIAKNRKGEAQNQAEIELLTDGYISQLGIVIPIVDYDKSEPPVWLQTELARVPKSSKEICDYLGCKSLHSLLEYANGFHHPWGYRVQERILKTIDPQKEETFLDYAQSLAELVNFNVSLADFMRYQNWGFYHGKPVIIDMGFTKEVARLYE